MLALCTAAQAVHVEPGGEGQALVFPYYSVQSQGGSPFNTYVSIVNTGPSPAVLRVRFREGRNAREVASFNVYLSSSDAWTGAIVPTADGAKIITADLSCMSPPRSGTGVFEVPFTNAAYAGSRADGAGEGLDRGREGFVEVIEMATFRNASVNDDFSHGADGLPRNCYPEDGRHTIPDIAAPDGKLTGTLTLINVSNGLSFSTNAIALGGLASKPYFRFANDPYPDFDAAEIDPVSAIESNGKSYALTWTRGIDAVTSVLMRTALMGEFVLDAGTRSTTDWLLAMPTRRFYVTPTTAAAPFTSVFAPVGLPGGPQCERAGLSTYNREGVPFSCDPAACTPVASLCWSASVLPFQAVDRSALGSANATAVGGASGYPLPFQNGHVSLAPSGAGAATTGLVSEPTSMVRDLATGQVTTGRFRVLGLPVVGFTASTFQNGTLTCNGALCQGNYGEAFPLKFRTSILPVTP
jgi:hypothetical protein